MNREELAKEFGVQPWSVDDWLLLGCPAQKIRMSWEFDLERVRTWIKIEKIRTLIKNNKKYAYVRLIKKNPAIDVATKLGMI